MNPPPVSVLVVCKDAAATIERCIASLLVQQHTSLQIVVQDGGSTDGTLEALRRFGGCLDLVSSPDRDQNEGFLRGLARCHGDVIGFCWADEELLPSAVQRGIEALGARPELGAVYGDLLETDLHGADERVLAYPDWSFERVFTYEFIPPVCASFFRRTVLAETFDRLVHLGPECTEYLLWVSVGSRYPIAHLAEPLARYARHGGQLSMRPGRMAAYAPQLAAAIERLAAVRSMPPLVRERKEQAIANVYLWAAQWLHEACGETRAALEQLECALAHRPDPAWLATVAWNAIRHSLARGDSAAIEAWLETLDARRARIVGHDYARTLASFSSGLPADACAAAEKILEDPYLDALWRLVPEIVRAFARGRGGERAPALDVLAEVARRRPAAHFPFSLALGELGEHERAASAASDFLAAYPDHEPARRWIEQLELTRCTQDEQLRSRIAAARGRTETLSQAEATQVADMVLRLLADPALLPRLPGPSRTALRDVVAAIRRTAAERGLSALDASLARLEPGLA